MWNYCICLETPEHTVVTNILFSVPYQLFVQHCQLLATYSEMATLPLSSWWKLSSHIVQLLLRMSLELAYPLLCVFLSSFNSSTSLQGKKQSCGGKMGGKRKKKWLLVLTKINLDACVVNQQNKSSFIYNLRTSWTFVPITCSDILGTIIFNQSNMLAAMKK